MPEPILGITPGRRTRLMQVLHGMTTGQGITSWPTSLQRAGYYFVAEALYLVTSRFAAFFVVCTRRLQVAYVQAPAPHQVSPAL